MKKLLLATIITILVCFGCKQQATHSLESNHNEITKLVASLQWKKFPTSKDKWPEEVKKLNPIKFYNDGANFVIALSQKNNIENGYYILSPISSYIPMNGRANWTFEKIGNDIWKYTRKIK